MGFWSTAGAFIGTVLEPGGGTAVGATIGGLLEGESDSAYCPGQPSRAAILAMLAAATAAERSELNRMWLSFGDGRAALFADRSFTQLAMDPEEFAHQVWGGSDCQVSSTKGKELNTYVRALLAKYAGGSVAAPAVTGELDSDSAIGQAWDILKEKLGELPEDVVGAVMEEVGRDVRDVTRPVIQERATERFLQELPVLAIGVVLALLLFRKR